MKERPILFSGPMIRAILDRRKTQTRRIVKPQPASLARQKTPWANMEELIAKCPYGMPGDRLWVREKWAGAVADGVPCICYAADFHRWYPPFREDGFDYEKYPCDYANWAADLERGTEGRWKPSIHMPRWASRITLEIVGVRVQRVQEISEVDAKAEGLEFMEPNRFAPPGGKEWMPHDAAFQSLWDFVNSPGAWERNDWVWAITFKVLEATAQ